MAKRPPPHAVDSDATLVKRLRKYSEGELAPLLRRNGALGHEAP